MDQLTRFLFDGLPVRGALVRLQHAWGDLLQRRAQTQPYPEPVQRLLGEVVAASVLLQSSIRFDGKLVVQIAGDGPVSLLVAEVWQDHRLRATATVRGEVPADAGLIDMVNANGKGRCAMTLDPSDRAPGQQAYQGVVPLTDAHGVAVPSVAQALMQYMAQSEQLDTQLVLAANHQVATGMLLQRMPTRGVGNLGGAKAKEAELGEHEDFNRLAMLMASLTSDELLQLEPEAWLHRLFWNDPYQVLATEGAAAVPCFGCNCSRQRVMAMLQGLGQHETESVIAEQGQVDVACEFCGARYAFDSVDAAQLFASGPSVPPPPAVQ